MSEPLRDLRAKVDTHTWIWLLAESQATGSSVSEIVRLILGEGMRGITGERKG